VVEVAGEADQKVPLRLLKQAARSRPPPRA
jgi:hypothetical protein